MTVTEQLTRSLKKVHDRHGKVTTVLIDPPWKFQNATGKGAPEHRRLHRYTTLENIEIYNLPVGKMLTENAHVYCWVPNALIANGIMALGMWGLTYKTMLVWHKIRKDGESDGRCMGFYFRNVTEVCLFGVKGKLRTLQPGRRQVNLFAEQKREHSRKPEILYDIIERCSPGPYLELFARHRRFGWLSWGNQL